MGRHKQPRELAEAKGADKKDPQRYRGEPPRPTDPVGTAPSYFSAGQKKAWQEIVDKSHADVLKKPDALAVELAAVLIDEHRETHAQNKKNAKERARLKRLRAARNKKYSAKVQKEMVESGRLAEIPDDPRDMIFPAGRMAQLVGLLARFGMTPSDRNKINLGDGDKDEEDWGEL